MGSRPFPLFHIPIKGSMCKFWNDQWDSYFTLHSDKMIKVWILDNLMGVHFHAKASLFTHYSFQISIFHVTAWDHDQWWGVEVLFFVYDQRPGSCWPCSVYIVWSDTSVLYFCMCNYDFCHTTRPSWHGFVQVGITTRLNCWMLVLPSANVH